MWSVEAALLSLWAVLFWPACAPDIDHKLLPGVDILAGQEVPDVLLGPVVAVLEDRLELAVIPGETKLELLSGLPLENLGDARRTAGEDLSPASLPPETTFTVIAWLVVGRVLDCDVLGVHSVPDVIASSPQVHLSLSSSWRVVRLADRGGANIIALPQSIGWVA